MTIDRHAAPAVTTVLADAAPLALALADDGLGAPAPFAAAVSDRRTLLGSAESPASATICIETTVSII